MTERELPAVLPDDQIGYVRALTPTIRRLLRMDEPIEVVTADMLRACIGPESRTPRNHCPHHGASPCPSRDELERMRAEVKATRPDLDTGDGTHRARRVERRPAPTDRLMSSDDLAAFLQVPRRTLDAWAYRGTGPKFVKVGRFRRYRAVDVERWLDTGGGS
jgi:predicted DNA-binding transcriptional regulator AlpA